MWDLEIPGKSVTTNENACIDRPSLDVGFKPMSWPRVQSPESYKLAALQRPEVVHARAICFQKLSNVVVLGDQSIERALEKVSSYLCGAFPTVAAFIWPCFIEKEMLQARPDPPTSFIRVQYHTTRP